MNAKEAHYEFKMKKNAHNKWIIVGTTRKRLNDRSKFLILNNQLVVIELGRRLRRSDKWSKIMVQAIARKLERQPRGPRD